MATKSSVSDAIFSPPRSMVRKQSHKSGDLYQDGNQQTSMDGWRAFVGGPVNEEERSWPNILIYETKSHQV